MTQPIGPFQPADSAQRTRKTTATAQLTIGSADVPMSSLFNAGFARRIVSQGSGTLYVSRVDDGGVFTPYVVAVGTELRGIFAAIGGSVTGSTSGLVCNLEI